MAHVVHEHGSLVVRSRFLDRREAAPLAPEHFMACRRCRLVYHVSADEILGAISSGRRVLFAKPGVLH
jgi:hypothetical protein